MSDFIVLKEKIETMSNRIDEIHHAIYGNGKPGLMIESDRNTRHRRFMEQWGWIIVTGISGIPFTVFSAVVLYAMKLK